MRRLGTMRCALPVGAALLLACPAMGSPPAPCCDPEGPFTLGEGFPSRIATCRSIGDWIDRAPETDGRISLSIEGEIAEIQWDGSLAYLLMCRAPNVQVMCVTYSRDGHEVGGTAIFSGGYRRVGDRHVMLDPCLAR